MSRNPVLFSIPPTGIRGYGMSVRKQVLDTLGPEKASAIRRTRHESRIRLLNALTGDGRHSARLLRSFQGKYEGERCVILGNGPSLNRTDLTRLRNEITFGTNRIYLLFGEMGFSTTFLVSINRHVLEQFGHEISQQSSIKLLGWDARAWLGSKPDTAFLQSNWWTEFSDDPVARGIVEGATVTFVALQLAYYMGFHKVILAGVDHSFETKGAPHKLITSTGPDPNHFSKDYFGVGAKWQLPDLDGSAAAYAVASKAFAQDGREILDATVGGKLQVFPKIDFHAYFTLGEGRS